MKKILCLIVAVMMLGSVCACTGDENSLLKGYEKSKSITEYDYLSGEDNMPENYDKYIKGSADFSFDILRATVSSKQEENTLVSPYSLSAALSLLSNGASDGTRKELRNALASGMEQEDINICTHYLSGRLSAFNTEDAKLTSANSLWFNDNFDVKSAFLQTAVNYYDADVQRVLFSEEDAAEKINNWISEKTDGEVTDAVNGLDETAQAIIVNAVLLDDEWATPYPDGSVNTGTFYGVNGEEEASFMTSAEQYLSTAYAQGMTKGFKNLPLRFAAIMPAEDMDINEFLEGLTGSKWLALLESQELASVCKATLPEFELRVKNDLRGSLEELGITRIFDAEKADFSNMSNAGKVSVSSVVQDAFVKIGPKNVKAGAATAIQGNGASAPGTEDMKELVFDKPFVFVIYDNESGIPVFTGLVNCISK